MMRRSMGFCSGLLFVLAACASRPPEAPATHDAQALLNAAPTLAFVALVHMDSRDTLYRFTPAQVDSLRSALKKSFGPAFPLSPFTDSQENRDGRSHYP